MKIKMEREKQAVRFLGEITALFFLILMIPSTTFSLSPEDRNGYRIENLRQLKKTVVFLNAETAEGKRLSGTGFLVNGDQNLYLLVTAKHNVIDPETQKRIDGNMQVYLNTKDGAIKAISIEMIKKTYGVDWIFHDYADIAVILFPSVSELYDVLYIPQDYFMQKDSLLELDDVIFCAYQPYVLFENITPLFRSGKISLIRTDGIIYIDAAVYPGNSGGPVFIELCINKGKVIVTTEDRTHRCKTRGVSGNSVFSERSFGATL